MFCREVRASVSPYLDGQLANDHIQRFKTHLDTCVGCKEQLDLMQEIPVALQTDRMLTPQPNFTKSIMQQIIIRQQIESTVIETQIESVNVQTKSANKIVSLHEYRVNRQPVRNATDYALWFSSAAAVLVVMVGLGIYITNTNNTSNSATASVYGAIQNFANTLSSGLSSPVELAAGVAIAAMILIGLWYTMKTLRSDEMDRRA